MNGEWNRKWQQCFCEKYMVNGEQDIDEKKMKIYQKKRRRNIKK